MELKIQKTDKIIIIFYAFLAIAFTIGILHIASTFDTIEHPIIFLQPVTELQITKIVDVNQEEAFLIMADIKNYPNILPRNIISVNIINQTDNNVLAEYEVVEHGIRAKLLVSHTMYPYDKHIVEVMDGDAKGTKLMQDFTTINTEIEKLPECDQSFDGCTKIDSRVELNLKGLLSPFSYLPKGNLDHASDTVISSFTNYMQLSKNETKKIIDDLYREILLRPADTESFEYWVPLLDNGSITVDEIRTEILNSDEKKSLLVSQEMKTVDELDDETKKIIDDLYREILLRPADTESFEYWGSLLENGKITKLELRKSILKSEEAISLKQFSAFGDTSDSIYTIFHEVYELNGPYKEVVKVEGTCSSGTTGTACNLISIVYDPRIDPNKLGDMVEKNKYRLNIEEITLEELRLELEQLKENGIDFFVDEAWLLEHERDLESVNEQFLDFQKRFVDKTDDFCYVCKWVLPNEN
jgi:hypothetical protein